MVVMATADRASLWQPAYVGLGSNLDDPAGRVLAAFDALTAIDHTRLVRRSSLYRSPPMGPPGQPDYVNAVAGLLTTLAPTDLLGALQSIERDQGRIRNAATRWGPRTLDLDLLVYGGQQIDEPALTVPHPGIGERDFVLLPLREIAPALLVPGSGSVSRLWAALGSPVLERIGPA
jgi:2-amino-4-hydroxy-6-hydroxymethyldihydropteridine diphosphokinase